MKVTGEAAKPVNSTVEAAPMAAAAIAAAPIKPRITVFLPSRLRK
jgi:hypothetical protein